MLAGYRADSGAGPWPGFCMLRRCHACACVDTCDLPYLPTHCRAVMLAWRFEHVHAFQKTLLG